MNGLLFLLLLCATVVVAQNTDRVCFYTNTDYGGTELCGMEGDRIDVYHSNLSLNDQFSSVRVPVGLQVLAFSNNVFYGESRIFTQDTPNLGIFSNIISSFIVQRAKVLQVSTEIQYTATLSEMFTTLPPEMSTSQPSRMYATTKSTITNPFFKATNSTTSSCYHVLEVCTSLILVLGTVIATATFLTCTLALVCVWR